MNWNTSRQWHSRRRGNFWIFPLIFLGLVILTHGWILFLPLMVLAGFAFFGFVLPKIMWHMSNSDWHSDQWNRSDWNNHDWSAWASRWQEKQKRHFSDWDDKAKNDDIEYV